LALANTNHLKADDLAHPARLSLFIRNDDADVPGGRFKVSPVAMKGEENLLGTPTRSPGLS